MKTILVIEDENAIRMNIVKMLNHSGFQAIPAENGLKGVHLARSLMPDLILCDILMPEMDGYSVLSSLRQSDDTVSIPFIFLTAKADRTEMRQGMNLGADDYLTKPFTAKELIEAIHSRLEKQSEVSQPYLDQIKKAAEALGNLAHFDPLTNLPNRIVLHHRIQETLQESQAKQQLFAVFYVSLSQFHDVNNAFGHTIGDLLIREVAERLRQNTGGNNTIARLGGVDFALVIRDVVDKPAIAQQAQQLLDAITEPYFVQGKRLSIQAHIGITYFPKHGDTATQLLSRADQAKRTQQTLAEKGFYFYNLAMEAADVTRRMLKSDLERGIQQLQFQLYYQPQISLLAGRIIGAEAFVRWQHPQKGLLTPHDFITLAEETGVIEELGQWVLHTACTQAQTWRSFSPLPLPVAINISSHQFQKKALINTIGRVLAETKLNPRLLTLEMSGDYLMEDPAYSYETLTALKAMGLNIHIDDFGTGSFHLGHLRHLPIDCLKIDQSLIAGIPDNTEHLDITKAIIRIAQTFKLRVIAEGVETDAQLGFLQEHGCYAMQGFVHSKPVTAPEFQALLLADKQRHQA